MPSSLESMVVCNIYSAYWEIYTLSPASSGTLALGARIACFARGYLLLEREPSRLRETKPPRGLASDALRQAWESELQAKVYATESLEVGSLLIRRLRVTARNHLNLTAAVQLCDFGVAGIIEAKADKRSTFIGTPTRWHPSYSIPRAATGKRWTYGHSAR